MITVAGVGPGSKEYLTEKVAFIVQKADIVAGWNHALKVIEGVIRGEKIQFTAHEKEEETIAYLAREARKGKKCIICTVGDPNFSDYQLLEKTRRYDEIEIVPGISSVQVAASLAQVSLEHTCFITFHKSGSIEGEKQELLEGIQKGKNLILLPRPYDFMPQDIANFLIEHGVDASLEVTIFENLTFKDERKIKTTIGELRGKFSDLSVIVIKVSK